MPSILRIVICLMAKYARSNHGAGTAYLPIDTLFEAQCLNIILKRNLWTAIRQKNFADKRLEAKYASLNCNDDRQTHECQPKPKLESKKVSNKSILMRFCTMVGRLVRSAELTTEASSLHIYASEAEAWGPVFEGLRRGTRASLPRFPKVARGSLPRRS